MTALSVVLPTCGRLSLAASVTSVLPELAPEDELIIVGDGSHDQKYARGVARVGGSMTDGPVWYLETTVPGSVYGNGQRQAGTDHARGTHIAYLDDDDVWNPGTGDLFREAAKTDHEAVHIFRAEWGSGHHWHGILWQDKELRQGNIGVPQVLWPNTGPLPLWMAYNALQTVSDFGWMQAAADGKRLVWHEEIVATVRP